MLGCPLEGFSAFLRTESSVLLLQSSLVQISSKNPVVPSLEVKFHRYLDDELQMLRFSSIQSPVLAGYITYSIYYWSSIIWKSWLEPSGGTVGAGHLHVIYLPREVYILEIISVLREKLPAKSLRLTVISNAFLARQSTRIRWGRRTTSSPTASA